MKTKKKAEILKDIKWEIVDACLKAWMILEGKSEPVATVSGKNKVIKRMFIT